MLQMEPFGVANNGQFLQTPVAMDIQTTQTLQSNPDQARFDFIRELPMDVTREIFLIAKSNLPSIACVSKTWKRMAYDEQLYKKLLSLLPIKLFGEEAWKQYSGDSGKEILLPLCIGRDIENGMDGWLTLVPETVKITNEDGTVQKVQINPENMGLIAKNPKDGHKTSYHPNAWRAAIKERRPREKMHWVWIKKEAIGRGETYQVQRRLAKAQSAGVNAAKGANVSGLLDTIVTAFMEKIRSGEGCFALGPVNGVYTWIRVNEQTQTIRIAVGFASAGLDVFADYDYGHDDVAVVVARKSFGR